jgi:hypothetical protein
MEIAFRKTVGLFRRLAAYFSQGFRHFSMPSLTFLTLAAAGFGRICRSHESATGGLHDKAVFSE